MEQEATQPVQDSSAVEEQSSPSSSAEEQDEKMESEENPPSQVETTEIASSPSPQSPKIVEIATSLPPTLESLDRKSPETEQDIFTLEQDLSSAPRRSNASSHASSLSAPCSPSRSLAKPSKCSLSQPASPQQVDLTQPIKPLELRIPDFCKARNDGVLKTAPHR
ncbi:hypothetical protein WMY93_029606 [Mugilogobius chulae]|uniref:Uncharacterized protein n=1 Tax=Mugilogobius chulae TaxID=88201 RepID=A0AAW0MPY8_9GOBI